jgi:hypothetical protein
MRRGPHREHNVLIDPGRPSGSADGHIVPAHALMTTRGQGSLDGVGGQCLEGWRKQDDPEWKSMIIQMTRSILRESRQWVPYVSRKRLG